MPICGFADSDHLDRAHITPLFLTFVHYTMRPDFTNVVTHTFGVSYYL